MFITGIRSLVLALNGLLKRSWKALSNQVSYKVIWTNASKRRVNSNLRRQEYSVLANCTGQNVPPQRSPTGVNDSLLKSAHRAEYKLYRCLDVRPATVLKRTLCSPKAMYCSGLGVFTMATAFPREVLQQVSTTVCQREILVISLKH